MLALLPVNPIDPRRSEALGWPLPGRLEALVMVKRPERWRTLLDKLKLYTTYFYDILASNWGHFEHMFSLKFFELFEIWSSYCRFSKLAI